MARFDLDLTGIDFGPDEISPGSDLDFERRRREQEQAQARGQAPVTPPEPELDMTGIDVATPPRRQPAPKEEPLADLDMTGIDLIPKGRNLNLEAEAPFNESGFQQWAKQMKVDPKTDPLVYDYRHAWLAGAAPDAKGHWPSAFKGPKHPQIVVGGFHTQTGERVPGTTRDDEAGLIRKGWSPEAAKQLATQPEPKEERELGSATSWELLMGSVDQAQQMLYGGVEVFAEMRAKYYRDPSAPELAAWAKAGRERNAKEFEDAGVPRMSFSDVHDRDSAAQYLKEMVLGQGPMMVPSLVGGFVGGYIGLAGGPAGAYAGAAVGAGIPSWLMGAGEIQADIKAINPKANTPEFAALGGAAVAVLDSVTPFKLGTQLVEKFGFKKAAEVAVRMMDTDGVGFLRRVGTAVVEGGISEGPTEAMQKVIADVTTSVATGKPMNWAQTFKDAIEEGIGGATVGVAFGGSVAALPSRQPETRRPRLDIPGPGTPADLNITMPTGPGATAGEVPLARTPPGAVPPPLPGQARWNVPPPADVMRPPVYVEPGTTPPTPAGEATIHPPIGEMPRPTGIPRAGVEIPSPAGDVTIRTPEEIARAGGEITPADAIRIATRNAYDAVRAMQMTDPDLQAKTYDTLVDALLRSMGHQPQPHASFADVATGTAAPAGGAVPPPAAGGAATPTGGAAVPPTPAGATPATPATPVRPVTPTTGATPATPVTNWKRGPGSLVFYAGPDEGGRLLFTLRDEATGDLTRRYLKTDGTMVDAEDINLDRPESAAELWNPPTEAARDEAVRLMDLLGQSMGDEAASMQHAAALEALVTAKAVPPVAPVPVKPPVVVTDQDDEGDEEPGETPEELIERVTADQQTRYQQIREYADAIAQAEDDAQRAELQAAMDELQQQYTDTYETARRAGADVEAMRTLVEGPVEDEGPPAEEEGQPKDEEPGEKEEESGEARIAREEQELAWYRMELARDDLNAKTRKQYEAAVATLEERAREVAEDRVTVQRLAADNELSVEQLEQLTDRERRKIADAISAASRLDNWRKSQEEGAWARLHRRLEEADQNVYEREEAAIPRLEVDADEIADHYDDERNHVVGPTAAKLQFTWLQADTTGKSLPHKARGTWVGPDGRTYVMTGQMHGKEITINEVVPEEDYTGLVRTYQDKIAEWDRNDGNRDDEGPVSRRGTLEGMEVLVRGKRYVATGYRIRIVPKGTPARQGRRERLQGSHGLREALRSAAFERLDDPTFKFERGTLQEAEATYNQLLELESDEGGEVDARAIRVAVENYLMETGSLEDLTAAVTKGIERLVAADEAKQQQREAQPGWTTESARAFLASIEGVLTAANYSAEIMGSVAVDGEGRDLDLSLTPTAEDYDFEFVMGAIDTEFPGAVWQETTAKDGEEAIYELTLPDGRVVDFFFEEAPAVEGPVETKPQTPKEMLRAAMTELGFTLSTDFSEIWNRMLRTVRRFLKGNDPTPEQMKAVVTGWADWIRGLKAKGIAGDSKGYRAAIRKALSTVKVEKPPPAPVVDVWAERFEDVLKDAREDGWTGTDEELADLYRERVDEAQEIARQLEPDQDSTTSGIDLLKAISNAGGFGIAEESGPSGKGGMVGELEYLLAEMAKRGVNPKTGRSMPKPNRGGVPGATNVVRRSGGYSVDTIREALEQDPRWEGRWEGLSDMLEEITEAIQIAVGKRTSTAGGGPTVLGILANLLGVKAGNRWWEPAPAVEEEQPTTTEEPTTEEQPTGPLTDEELKARIRAKAAARAAAAAAAAAEAAMPEGVAHEMTAEMLVAWGLDQEQADIILAFADAFDLNLEERLKLVRGGTPGEGALYEAEGFLERVNQLRKAIEDSVIGEVELDFYPPEMQELLRPVIRETRRLYRDERTRPLNLRVYARAVARDLAKRDRNKTLFQYAGENADLPAFHRDSLAAARAMAAAGKPADEIRRVTGWFPGKYDGKLRWEIPDHNADLRPAFLAQEEIKFMEEIRGRAITLHEALAHPELFLAYPHLANIKVERRRALGDSMGMIQGWYDDERNVIIVSPSADNPFLTLLHEVQHAIQRHERFARGGNQRSVLSMAADESVLSLAQQLQKELAAAQAFAKTKQDNLNAAHDELVQAWDTTDSETAHQATNIAQDYIHAAAEYQKLIQTPGTTIESRRPAFDRLGELNAALRKVLPDQSSPARVAFLLGGGFSGGIENVNRNLGVGAELLKKLDQDITTLDRKDVVFSREVIKSYGRGFDLYRRLAGEIEARDTEARWKLTEAERAATEPYSSENIAPDQAIVAFRDEVSTSEEYPETEIGMMAPDGAAKTRSRRMVSAAFGLGNDHGDIAREFLPDVTTDPVTAALAQGYVRYVITPGKEIALEFDGKNRTAAINAIKLIQKHAERGMGVYLDLRTNDYYTASTDKAYRAVQAIRQVAGLDTEEAVADSDIDTYGPAKRLFVMRGGMAYLRENEMRDAHRAMTKAILDTKATLPAKRNDANTLIERLLEEAKLQRRPALFQATEWRRSGRQPRIGLMAPDGQDHMEPRGRVGYGVEHEDLARRVFPQSADPLFEAIRAGYVRYIISSMGEITLHYDAQSKPAGRQALRILKENYQPGDAIYLDLNNTDEEYEVHYSNLRLANQTIRRFAGETLYQAAEGPKEDILPTGERQPRLPGAEDVRDQEVEQPQLGEVDFGLQQETEIREEVQETLFGPAVKPVKAKPAKERKVPPGQESLFQKGRLAKASIEFVDGVVGLVRALNNPDVSSAFHEITHAVDQFLFDRTLPEDERLSDAEIDTAEAWAGGTLGPNGDEHARERFARGMERYLFDGVAPSEALRRIFEKAAEWLRKIYTHFEGSSIDIEVSPEMRAIYARLLMRKESRLAAERSARPAATPERTALIERIVAASRTPMDPIVEQNQYKGSDGNWYFVHGVPYGVELDMNEKRSRGFAFQGRESIYGYGSTNFPTAKSLEAEWEHRQRKGEAALKTELEKMSDAELENQRAHWLKEGPEFELREHERHAVVLARQVRERQKKGRAAGGTAALYAQMGVHVRALLDGGRTVDQVKAEIGVDMYNAAIKAEAPTTTDEEQPAISFTQEGSYLVLKFKEKPEQAILDAIKSQGYRWHAKQKVWMARFKADVLTGTEQLLGIKLAGERATGAEQQLAERKAWDEANIARAEELQAAGTLVWRMTHAAPDGVPAWEAVEGGPVSMPEVTQKFGYTFSAYFDQPKGGMAPVMGTAPEGLGWVVIEDSTGGLVARGWKTKELAVAAATNSFLTSHADRIREGVAAAARKVPPKPTLRTPAPTSSDLLSEATDFISELNQSRNPAKTADEAYQRYLNNVGASRGTPHLDAAAFTAAWEQMQRPGDGRLGFKINDRVKTVEGFGRVGQFREPDEFGVTQVLVYYEGGAGRRWTNVTNLEAAPESAAGPAKGVTPLPRELAGAKPRYGYIDKHFQLSFESPLDLAGYIIAQKDPSKADAGYLVFVMESLGVDKAGAEAFGRSVRDRIKPLAKAAKGGTTAKPELLTIPATAETRPPTPPPTTHAPPTTPAGDVDIDDLVRDLIGGDVLEQRTETGEALAVIRNHGFDVELYDEAEGAWIVTPGDVSDEGRSTGRTSKRAVPPAVKKALAVLNSRPMAEVERAISGGGNVLYQQAEPPTSPAFRRWFGKSQVVGPDNKPLRVYHGTTENISEFRSSAERGTGYNAGMYFTQKPSLASQYARRRGKDAPGSVVYPVYLSIQNPLIVDYSLVEKAARELTGKRPPSNLYSAHLLEEQVEDLKKQGYDGIINKTLNEYVVFDSSQVKSATGNVGSYAPYDTNILFQQAEPSSLLAELEAMSTDEAMGVRFSEDEESTFPDGTAAVNCTNCADQIIRTLGRGEVYGWQDGDNPTSIVSGPTKGARTDKGQGHDFAVIDDRYLVDPWAKNVEMSTERAAWDLFDPADRAEVKRLYGDPETWMVRGTRHGKHVWISAMPRILQPGGAPVVPPATPAFQRWFKASKVVDAAGRPLRTYHGTRKDFEAFRQRKSTGGGNPLWLGDLGFWFTAPSFYPGEYEPGNAEDVAASFAEAKKRETPIGPPWMRYGKGARVLPMYLSIQNPREFESWDELDELRHELYVEKADDPEKVPLWRVVTGKQLQAALQKQGYDGLVIRNSMTDGNVDRDDWVAFRRTQIKSALANQGQYSAEEPNFLYQAEETEFDEQKLDILIKIVRRYLTAGVTDFPTVARGFVAAFDKMGANARQYDLALESVWEDLQGETVTVEGALSTEQPPTPQPPDPNPPATFSAAVYRRIMQAGWSAVLQGAEGSSVTLRKHVAALGNWTLEHMNQHITQFEDAIEAVLNQTLGDNFRTSPPTSLQDGIERALKIEEQMPRAHRTIEKMRLQQFSTPLPIATAAAYAADVRDGDVLMEPTAGTGNLLAPLRQGPGNLAVEMDPNRAELLREQGINVFGGDYLVTPFMEGPQRPTVIIANPPWGKYSTGKYGRPVSLEFMPVDVAERFVAKMYRDLAPGGRIVAIMPTTMLESHGFKNWLRYQTSVRAIIQSPPGAYDTRGTTVDSILLVFDKVKPDTKTLPAVLTPQDWTAYAQAVETVPRREVLAVVTPERPTGPTAGAGAGGRPGGVSRPGSRPGRPGGGRDVIVPPGRPDADVVADEQGTGTSEGPGPTIVDQPGTTEAGATGSTDGEFANVTDHSADDRKTAGNSQFFAPYARRTTLQGVGHPKLIVEARGLAGVPYPPLTLPAGPSILKALREKRVSVEQAEQALAALQANIVNHHGYLAADNVGVGKSREIALVILELMDRAKAENRELRLVVTTKGRENIADLIDAELYYVATGRTRDGRDLMNPLAAKAVPDELDFPIVKTDEWPAAKKAGQEYKPMPKHKRALYVTDFYNLSAFRQGLVDIEPHGIIGDEAHRFKNIEGAAAGGAWQNLHAMIMRGVPRAEQVFAYFTATPAQSVYDYQYLYGLRLWPIDGFTQWTQIVTGNGTEEDARRLQEATDAGAFNMDNLAAAGGATVIGGDSEDTPAAAPTGRPVRGRAGSDIFTQSLTPAEGEQIPREWKMQGRFSARDLWREGQEFIVHNAVLPEKHKAKYDEFAELAQAIAAAQYRFGLLDRSGSSSKFGVNGMLQFAAKRIQMVPALEEAIKVAQTYLDQGYQVVLSAINVNEMDPEAGNIAAAIEKINTRIRDNDPNDPHGGIIDMGEIPEALVVKAELLERARDLGIFPDPVQMVKDAFGADKVAFIVGNAAPGARRIAMDDFQSGKRKLVFLSAAGSTGINLDHRILSDHEPGRGRRVFLDVQFEWSATEAIQRYGRVGRAASVTQPVLMPITFGNASEKKFLATIANRMAALGALSKGGAETTGAQGLEEFEITGPEALAAARQAYNDMPETSKRRFSTFKSVFRSPNRDPHQDPFEPAATAPARATMKDYQLGLLLVPVDVANGFWEAFVAHREAIREQLGHQTANRTEMFKGEVLRVTNLGTEKAPLTLTEVKNNVGARFGILSGLITPRMPRIRDFLYTPDPNGRGNIFSRRYVSFTGTSRGEEMIISGLQIPWGKVKQLADAFGAELTMDRLDTPEKVLAALKAGERVELQQETNGKPWVLSYRRDEKILITNAKMADQQLLLNNGGAYSSVGNFWFVADNATQFERFLERFPVAAPKAKTAEATAKSEGPGPGASGTAQSAPQPGVKKKKSGPDLPVIPGRLPVPWGASITGNTVINPVPTPLLVELAKVLIGLPRIVKRFRGTQDAEFKPGGRNAGIRLHAGLFKKGRERELAAALAHEIGHLIDWLPHHTLKRGNLLGRIFSLHRFMEGEFTASDGTTVKNKEMREELKNFSLVWRDWDPTTATDKFKAYRNSSKELYADAISGLLINPGLLQRHAPRFYEHFFKALDAKPEVEMAYFELQAVLEGTPDEIIRRQRMNDRKGYTRGNKKAIEKQQDSEKRKEDRKHSVITYLRHVLWERNTVVIDLVNELARKGIAIAEDANPLNFLRESNYIASKNRGWLKTFIQPIYNAVGKAGVSWEDVGEVLQNQRIAHGDRSEIANPGHTDPEIAAAKQAQLEDDLGPDKANLAVEAANGLREALHGMVEFAAESGLFNAQTIKMMRENKFYSPFQVVEYMEAQMNWRVIQQVGTFQEINNPADALIMKALSTQRAAERNRMTLSVVDFLLAHHQDEIHELRSEQQGGKRGEMKWNGKFFEPQEPKHDPQLGLITYYRNGKLHGAWVDAYIAESVNKASIGHSLRIMTALKWITLAPFWRGILTGYNPGFHTWNFQRDFFRFWKNMPGVTFRETIKLYAKAFPAAYVRAGKPGYDAANWVLSQVLGFQPMKIDFSEAEEKVAAGELAGILGVTYGDLNLEGLDSQMLYTFAKHGVAGDPSKLDPNEYRYTKRIPWTNKYATISLAPVIPAVNAVKPFFDFLKAIGDLTETLPKMAAIEYLSKDGDAASLTPTQRDFIRRFIGSPDFLAGGTYTAAFNKIFIYSNAIAQGQRTDFQIMKESIARDVFRQKGYGVSGDLETRKGKRSSATMWRTVALNFVPKLITKALLLGVASSLFDDDDDDWLPDPRRVLQRVSEYDITNYLVVPLGMDKMGNAVIARIPQDFSGQLFGALFWKGLQWITGDKVGMETLSQVVDFTQGQIPSTTPLWQGAWNTIQMASGKNPYDWYRGRTVLTPQEQEARLGGGEAEAWTKFIGWEFQQSGGGLVWKFYPGERPRQQTGWQMFLEAPLLSNVAGRIFKITNYGITEKLLREQRVIKGQETQLNRLENDRVMEQLEPLRRMSPARQDEAIPARAEAIVRELYPNATREQQNRQEADVREKITSAIAKQGGVEMTSRIMAATTNAQKVGLIRRAKDFMTAKQYRTWVDDLIEDRVISPAVEDLLAQPEDENPFGTEQQWAPTKAVSDRGTPGIIGRSVEESFPPLDDDAMADLMRPDRAGGAVNRRRPPAWTRSVTSGAGENERTQEVVVPPPYPFGKVPEIPDVAVSRKATAIFKAFPGLQEMVTKIASSPTTGAADVAESEKFPAEELERSNLLGVYDKRTKDVYIRPNRTERGLAQTLAHELAHANGWSEYVAQRVGRTIEQWLPKMDSVVDDLTPDELDKLSRELVARFNKLPGGGTQAERQAIADKVVKQRF